MNAQGRTGRPSSGKSSNGKRSQRSKKEPTVVVVENQPQPTPSRNQRPIVVVTPSKRQPRQTTAAQRRIANGIADPRAFSPQVSMDRSLVSAYARAYSNPREYQLNRLWPDEYTQDAAIVRQRGAINFALAPMAASGTKVGMRSFLVVPNVNCPILASYVVGGSRPSNSHYFNICNLDVLDGNSLTSSKASGGKMRSGGAAGLSSFRTGFDIPSTLNNASVILPLKSSFAIQDFSSPIPYYYCPATQLDNMGLEMSNTGFGLIPGVSTISASCTYNELDSLTAIGTDLYVDLYCATASGTSVGVQTIALTGQASANSGTMKGFLVIGATSVVLVTAVLRNNATRDYRISNFTLDVKLGAGNLDYSMCNSLYVGTVPTELTTIQNNAGMSRVVASSCLLSNTSQVQTQNGQIVMVGYNNNSYPAESGGISYAAASQLAGAITTTGQNGAYVALAPSALCPFRRTFALPQPTDNMAQIFWVGEDPAITPTNMRASWDIVVEMTTDSMLFPTLTASQDATLVNALLDNAKDGCLVLSENKFHLGKIGDFVKKAGNFIWKHGNILLDAYNPVLAASIKASQEVAKALG